MDVDAHLHLEWQGPFKWPKHRNDLPACAGAYLWAYDYLDSYLVYAVGITRRPFSSRFAEHTKSFHDGVFSLYDLEQLSQGVKRTIWKGQLWKKRDQKMQQEFESRKTQLHLLANQQMQACRIFACECTTKPRILERLEAEMMRQLYTAEKPFSDIPPKGMRLSPRWPSEPVINVTALFPANLRGLLNRFTI